MNKNRSQLVWIIYVILLVGLILGFAHGAKTLDVSTGKGIAWMLGSLAVFCAGIYISYKWKKLKD